MQFVISGPDVPNDLLQAHEEGRVVFFCGAGISYPAGLPLFRGLVEQIFEKTGMSMNQLEQAAFARSQFDAALDLLERRHQGGRQAVRKAMVESLQPSLRRAGATTTHEALLDLARDKSGALRLVTTNFDQIFEILAARQQRKHAVYSAPTLPIPKKSRWDGLVYLHGLQPLDGDGPALNRLVVTSGDFGLAYLIERWAARFVTELFRNYVVCFVGYGINDPVLRYMMDALAADRMLGEITPQAYAFGSFKKGYEHAVADDWRAKGVEPVLYEVVIKRGGSEDHSLMSRTLDAWAKTYQAGSMGKEAIVSELASANPSESTAQDDFVGRMLWALAHPDGLPAKRFADMTPCPPLRWLKAFADPRFRHSDLVRFGVTPNSESDAEVRFSLMRRPSPYTHSPWMSLCSSPLHSQRLDLVMHHVSRWLLRHLGDPELLLWLAETGTVPHDGFKLSVESELTAIEKLEAEGDTKEISSILDRSPNAIPSRTLRALWRYYLSGRLRASGSYLDLHGWTERAKLLGATGSVRAELRDFLEPRLEVRRSWREDSALQTAPRNERERLRLVLDWDLVLAAEHVQTYLSERNRDPNLHRLLPALLPDVEQLLREAIEMQIEVGNATASSDRSVWDLPSVEPHHQNRNFREWVILMELLRDGWLQINEQDALRAARIAQEWFSSGYASFRRLALYAASQPASISDTEWVTWLVGDEGIALWSSETQREVLRLLVLRGGSLDKRNQARLEGALLIKNAKATLSALGVHRRKQVVAEHAVWLRLAKLASAGLELGNGATARLKRIESRHPDWVVEHNQSDEFSYWMTGSGEDDFEQQREIELAPRKRHEIVEWIKTDSGQRSFFYEDTWRDTCRTRFFHAALALADLSKAHIWPAGRWKEALQAWAEPGLASKAWRWVSDLVVAMPDETFEVVARNVSHWLQTISTAIAEDDQNFLALCDRLLDGKYPEALDTDAPVARAINHPVGHVTQGLLSYWFKRNPSDGDGLPQDIKLRFDRLLDMSRPQNRHGRVLLASRLIALFRIDREWTEAALVPSFSWASDRQEAAAVWSGFLWSPRLHMPLLLALKPYVLQTPSHFSDLCERSDQFAAFLTYLAIGPAQPTEGYSRDELRLAVASLPQEGLQQVAATLSHALEGSGERREEYWQTRVLPVWQHIWPKDKSYASAAISSHIASLTIAAAGKFPEALSLTCDWLIPLDRPHFVLRKLRQSEHPARFPAESLQLISALVKTLQWDARDLKACLDSIEASKPSLGKDARFIGLMNLCRALGP